MDTFPKIIPSLRTQHITYAIRDILAIANERKAAGGDLIFLNIGDPLLFDFDTPPHLIEATYQAMKERHNGYSPSEGIGIAIDAIHKQAVAGGITPTDILITTGASEGIDLALSALVNHGENVLVPSPGYPLYNALLSRLLAEGKPYILDENNNWQPDIAHMESQIDSKTKAIVLINPNNPTGAVYTEDTLREIIKLAIKYHLVILSDEIYDKLILNSQKHISIASLNHDIPIVTFNGISKCYLAPGFRIGWAIISGARELTEDYVEGMKKLARARLCACHPEQYAIPAALQNGLSHLQLPLEKLKRRRDLTVEMLNAIPGISCQVPNGAFYAFPKVDVPISDEEFVKHLIRETGVVVVHGSGFGPFPASPHFRLAFLPTENELEKAYSRLDGFMRKHYGA